MFFPWKPLPLSYFKEALGHKRIVSYLGWVLGSKGVLDKVKMFFGTYQRSWLDSAAEMIVRVPGIVLYPYFSMHGTQS